MTSQALTQHIWRKKSYLCVGLDTDPTKIPAHLRQSPDPIFEFNKQIIDATADFCVAYKPNWAFYEALGSQGWDSLQKTLEYIPDEMFVIADAKRGDIGNTAHKYAAAFFEHHKVDAVTLSPYMGYDSVSPFTNQPNRWAILLALTSNPGSADFQLLELRNGRMLFEQVIETALTWPNNEQLMFVVGATQAEMLGQIRQLAPEHFLLVPGVGVQGGSLEQVSRYGLNAQGGLLVNASRSILYAADGTDFAIAARREALALKQEMGRYLEQYGR
ncbi:orotidine-5'-phosphate decarboxylase [Eisenibacter elegans]|jgi:orotidine-5'-phosphate decarboxylase|uniref:orotidine-5'-phosphate decarboxylase n=1 Tax=Eisenibacter elegans TaxID=997 RepID=UPI0003FE7393|nr:orotidine-5'-phosphate decarboxylase [Eisenibacter elegans]